MKSNRSIITLGILLGSGLIGHATVIGFGNLGGNNATVPASLGSNATANGNGFVVTNGTTPNIAVSWDANWDIHTSSWFNPLESLTVGGGAWDNEGSIARVGQLDTANHSITFGSDAAYAVVLNSFDFGQTAESTGSTIWNITLTAVSTSTVVWSSNVTLTSTNPSTPDFRTFSPNFTGTTGEDYLLRFNRTDGTGYAAGRHAIDNLSFNQVPEFSMTSLAGLGAAALLIRRRRR